MQARQLRLQVLNLLACIVRTGFDAARHDEDAHVVLEVGPDDEQLRYVFGSTAPKS